MIRDYFDLGHLDKRAQSTERLKTAVANLKSGTLVEESYARLINLTRSRNPDASYIAGCISEFGLFGQPQNDTFARRLYSLGAEFGSPECKANLAFFLRYGIGGAPDLKQAAALTESAKPASIWATLHTAMALRHGIQLPPSCSSGFTELVPLAQTVLANTSAFRRFGNEGVARIPAGSLPRSDQAALAAELELAKILAGAGSDPAHIAAGKHYLRMRPPDYENAKRHFREAAENDHPDGSLFLYMIESTESSASENSTQLIGYLRRALFAGSLHARTELARMQLDSSNPETREQGVSHLNASVEGGDIEAIYLMALEQVHGRPPYAKNITEAFQRFEFCLNHDHHAVLFDLALLHSRGIAPTAWSCNQTFGTLLLFLELSFLFDDSAVAWKAVTAGDLPHALRLYARLADMGSETAAWNAERLSTELGLNSTAWFDLQLQMDSPDAIRRVAERRVDTDEGIEMLAAAAQAAPAAAFALAWAQRRGAWAQAERNFAHAVALRRKAALPVRIARGWIFVEKLPNALRDWRAGRQTADWKFVRGVLLDMRRPAIAVGILAVLYLLIGVRVRMFCRASEGR